MIVVSDTTAITSLLKIGELGLLRQLFTQVIIPVAVQNELLRYHTELPGFIEVREIQNRNELPALLGQLDPGESEAILLAEESNADALLIDERLGRGIAEGRGLRCLGLPGALLLAKEQGILPRIEPIINRLASEANFRLAASVKADLLARAGEPLEPPRK